MLLVTYCAMSVVGLLLVKGNLPGAREAFRTSAYLAPAVLLLIVGLTLYVASFLTWIGVLARLPLSVAYPAAIGLTLIFSTLGAMFFLGEPVGPLKFAGICLIILGIIFVTRS